jgi:hypothetical protein
VALVDREGQPVWASAGQDPESSLVSAAWTEEGMWTLQEARNDSKTTQVVLQSLDGGVLEVYEAADAHHHLTPMPNGGVAWLEADARDIYPYGLVYGDRVVVAAPGESPVEAFNTWDLLGEPSESETWASNWYLDGFDWTHANGITYNEVKNSFLLSLAGQSMVLALDADDATILWTIEGQSLSPAEAGFVLQHSPTWTADDTVMLFVNEGVSSIGSYAAEFQVGGSNATEIWNSGRDTLMATHALGRASRLPGGNTLINYGLSGLLQEVDEDGGSLWQLELTGDWILGQSDLVNLYEE